MTDYEFEYLQDMVDRYKQAYHDYYGYAEIRIDEDECKAIESAISALSENKGDLISRQAVNNVLYDLGLGDEENGGDPEYMSALYDCKEFIDQIPSVENKGEWILVSERLPKIADVYRVTRYYPNNVMNPNYLVDACFFDGSNTWYNDNRINHERAYVDNVIAWQENPEPYKAESEDKE